MSTAPESLTRAFAAFNHRSEALESAYLALAARVKELDRDLQRANRRLASSLVRSRRTRRTLRDLLANLSCGVAILAADGRVRFANAQARRLARLASACPAVHGEGEKPGRSSGWERILPDPAEIVASARPGPGWRQTRILKGPGGVRRHLELMVSRTGEGSAAGFLVLMNDVTDGRLLEEVQSRSSRLEAMGRMAVEIAHEVRNPLGSVELFAGLLVRDLAGDPEHLEMAQMLQLGARSIAAVIGNMLSFTRSFPPSGRLVDLGKLARESLELASAAARARQICLKLRLRPGALLAGNPELLRQILLNLIQNGLEACSPGGQVWLHVFPAAGGVALAIHDTGCGMESGEIARIFDPFYSGRENGTGLGLAVVHRLVEHHGGEISIRSSPGRGSRFLIRFPPPASASLEARAS
ncbi:MAG: nitrogen regulation protein NR(II) [Acidobacteriota bacterium]